MKISLVLLPFMAISTSAAAFRQKTSDVISMIESYGYKADTYDVTTSDGYILDLYRIYGRRSPQSSQNNIHSSEENSNTSEDSKEVMFRKTVLLMHGFMSSSVDFVIGGPGQALALYLADQGYDVFMGNARGSAYGQRHTTLNPTRDQAFWKFCWQEIGTHDLPAIVDKVISVSHQRKISYVGHMEGTTAFYVLTSQKPEYNNKFDKMISMGPMAFMQHSKSNILEQISQHGYDQKWLMKNLGKSTFRPSNDLLESERNECRKQGISEQICRNSFMNLYGYSNHLNQTTINNYLPHVPSGGSVREVLHFAQLKQSGRFEMYRENSAQSENEYDLSKITVPVAIVYTPNDRFADVQDVNKLVKSLPKVMGPVNFEQLTNNMDLLFSENVKNNIYPVVKKMLREEPEKMLIHA